MSRVPSRNANKHTIKRRLRRKIKAGLIAPAEEKNMDRLEKSVTFVTAQKTQEIRRQNGIDETVDVFIFGNRPHVYPTLEEAAEANVKLLRKNILSTWCVFEMVSETKTEDYPIKTYLVDRSKDFAGSAEP